MAFSSQEHHTVITATPTKQKKYHVIAELEIDTKALITVQPVCFSYNNKYLAIEATYENSEKRYMIYDVSSQELIFTIPITFLKNKKYKLIFSADSSRVVVAHSAYGKFDSSIAVYDVENKRRDQIYPKVKDLFFK